MTTNSLVSIRSFSCSLVGVKTHLDTAVLCDHGTSVSRGKGAFREEGFWLLRMEWVGPGEVYVCTHNTFQAVQVGFSFFPVGGKIASRFFCFRGLDFLLFHRGFGC